MKLTDEKLEQRMLRMFRRHGGGTAQEGLFDALNPQSSTRLLASSNLREREKAVLAGWGCDGVLLVVTTRRLLFIAKQEAKSIEISSVQRASVDLVAELERGCRSKKHWHTLMFELTSGKRVSFLLQEQVSFWAFLNTVKWLVDSSKT